MSSEQIKIASSNKSFIFEKHAKPTMDLSQVTIIKHGKVGKSSIPSVPVNYTCPKRQKTGKSFIPRFMVIHSKQTKNVKPVVNTINSLGKDKFCKPVKDRRSYIPRKTAKKVEHRLNNTQVKPQQKNASSPLFGKSKIPVPISTKKTNASTSNNSTKKVKVMTRTIHSRKCSTCSPSLDVIKREKKVKKVKKEKKENARVLRSNVVRDNQERVLTFNPTKDAKDDDTLSCISVASSCVSTASSCISTTSRISTTSSCISTSTSIKNSLIPVHNKLTYYNLFKRRVSPIQPSAITLIKKDDLTPTSTSNKKSIHTSLESRESKCTSLQKSVNKPEALISISRNKVEVSTIKPELSSISLLHKAEKDLSGVRHKAEENDKGVPTLFGNVFKSIKVYFQNYFK